MKLCKDCKHARPDRFVLWLFSNNRWNYAKCGRVEPMKKKTINPVTGKETIEKIEISGYCSVERKDYSHPDVCGVEGKYWESK